MRKRHETHQKDIMTKEYHTAKPRSATILRVVVFLEYVYFVSVVLDSQRN